MVLGFCNALNPCLILVQATIDRHTQASAECASIERQLQQHQTLLHRASSSAAVARAAANATMEQQALLAISIQKRTKQVGPGRLNKSSMHVDL